MPLMVCLTTEKNSTYYYNITTTTIITTTTYKKERATKIRTFLNTYHGLDSNEGKMCQLQMSTLQRRTEKQKKIEEFFYTFWLRLANLCFDQSITRHLENITTTFLIMTLLMCKIILL
jgi:nitric oxide reductase large subunit